MAAKKEHESTTKLKITKDTIDKKCPYTERGRVIYRDTEKPGFGLRVGTNIKAFFVQKKIAGKKVFYTLGIYPQMTPDDARKQADIKLGEMAKGTNPFDKKREEKAHKTTLEEVYRDYLESNSNLKPKTIYDYTRCIELAFKDWKRKPITEITKDMVERRHKKLGDERGAAYANLSMRVLRALFNYAQSKYETGKGEALIRDNPVRRLSQVKAWFKINRRDDYIKSDSLPDFFKVLDGIVNDTLRDYFTLILFTGLRREEAARMKWGDVDLKNKTFTITETKNREKLVLPITAHLMEMFGRRKQTAGNGEWVFPGNGKDGHITEPKYQINKMREGIGSHITVHGLRRTYATIAESLDISQYTLKRLLNHKQGSDVTGGYVVSDPERLRQAAEMIAAQILLKGGRRETGKVIQMPQGKRA